MRTSLWILAGVLVAFAALAGCRRTAEKPKNVDADGDRTEAVATSDRSGASSAIAPGDRPARPATGTSIGRTGAPLRRQRPTGPGDRPAGSQSAEEPNEAETPEMPDPADHVRALAAEGKTADVLNALKDHPEWATSTDPQGRSLLHVAAQTGQRDVVAALVERPEFDLKLKDSEGNAPLALAAREGQADVVAFLILRGADVTAANAEGHTALDLAATAAQAATLPHSPMTQLVGRKRNSTSCSPARKNTARRPPSARRSGAGRPSTVACQPG